MLTCSHRIYKMNLLLVLYLIIISYLFIMMGSKNVTVFMRCRSRMNSSVCALHSKESWFTSSGIVAPENRLVSG